MEKFIDYNHKKEKLENITDIKNKLLNNHSYLFQTFFIENNIYYSVYFNNLIKYFLPLPFDFNIYSPIITYRSNINNNKIYKTNSIDYYDKIYKVDYKKTSRNVDMKKRNKDIIQNEIDIHIPIKYFKNYFNNNNNDNYIFCVGIKNKMYIVKNIKIINDIMNMDILYSRNKIDIKDKNNNYGYPLESLNSKWKKNNSILSINIQKIIYISVLKKITEDDLLNVFGTVNYDKNELSYLYHETGLDINKKKFDSLLSCPTFFSPTPIFYKENHFYYADKKCLFYKLKKNINKLLDLTYNISIVNPFNENNKDNLTIKDKIENNKFFDLNDLDNFYKNKDLDEINKITKDKYKCLMIEEKFDLNNYVKNRWYCDTNKNKYYVGRRKLQEILFKTRKYLHGDIWIPNSDKNFNNNIKKNYSNEYFKNNIYHPSLKMKCNMFSYNYDAVILSQIKNVTGFFFTDYIDRINTGGELFLCNPSKYIELHKYSLDKCFNKNLVTYNFDK